MFLLLLALPLQMPLKIIFEFLKKKFKILLALKVVSAYIACCSLAYYTVGKDECVRTELCVRVYTSYIVPAEKILA